MNLREMAEKDLSYTLEDKFTGFGVDVKFTDLSGNSLTIVGQYHREYMSIDPETGVSVNTKKSAVTFRTSALSLGKVKNGWKVETTDISGNIFTGYVVDIFPDETLGKTSIILREGN